MEQLYNTQYTISVFMNPNVFKDEGARRQKRCGIRGSYSRLKAVSDVNLTDTQTGMSRKDEEVSITGGVNWALWRFLIDEVSVLHYL